MFLPMFSYVALSIAYTASNNSAIDAVLSQVILDIATTGVTWCVNLFKILSHSYFNKVTPLLLFYIFICWNFFFSTCLLPAY